MPPESTLEAHKACTLLSDPNVKRCYDNLLASSPSVADVFLRRISRFSELAKVDVEALVSLSQKDLEDKV
jgi:hypothetical protein